MLYHWDWGEDAVGPAADHTQCPQPTKTACSSGLPAAEVHLVLEVCNQQAGMLARVLEQWTKAMDLVWHGQVVPEVPPDLGSGAAAGICPMLDFTSMAGSSKLQCCVYSRILLPSSWSLAPCCLPEV